MNASPLYRSPRLTMPSPKGGIIVTENGAAVHEPTVEVAQDDKARIAYYEGYVAEMHEAIEQGADVRGYYAWSFMDNFGECCARMFTRPCRSQISLVAKSDRSNAIAVLVSRDACGLL